MPRFFRAPPRIPTRADIDAVLRVTDSDDHARDHLLVALPAFYRLAERWFGTR